MPLVGFEPTISVSEWPQTHVLDRAATGTGFITYILYLKDLGLDWRIILKSVSGIEMGTPSHFLKVKG